MSRWVCKLCVIQKGLKGSDLDQWPENPDDAWIAEHLRTAHGVEVRGMTDALTRAVGSWVPFDQRPRPDADLFRASISVSRMKSIEIMHDDEAAIGRIFAWLMGQIALARVEIDPATRKDWGFD